MTTTTMMMMMMMMMVRQLINCSMRRCRQRATWGYYYPYIVNKSHETYQTNSALSLHFLSKARLWHLAAG